MDTFDSLRPYLPDYLHHLGINPSRRFRCLNPEHLDRNPSMGYDARRQKVHCFACGADYDLFDLLELTEGLSSPGEALALASALYGDGSADRNHAYRKAFPQTTASAAAKASMGCAASGLQPEEASFSHRKAQRADQPGASLSEGLLKDAAEQGSERNASVREETERVDSPKTADNEGDGAILSDLNGAAMDGQEENGSRTAESGADRRREQLRETRCQKVSAGGELPPEPQRGACEQAPARRWAAESEASAQLVENFSEGAPLSEKLSTEGDSDPVTDGLEGDLEAAGAVFEARGRVAGADAVQNGPEGGLNGAEAVEGWFQEPELSTEEADAGDYWQVEDLLELDSRESLSEPSAAAPAVMGGSGGPAGLAKAARNWELQAGTSGLSDPALSEKTGDPQGDRPGAAEQRIAKSVSHETKSPGGSDANLSDGNTGYNGVNMEDSRTFRQASWVPKTGEISTSQTVDVANATDFTPVPGSGSDPVPGYLTACAQHRSQTDYFLRRGISDGTAERFSLGYDPDSDCVVLPCAEGAFVRRSVSGKRYFNQKGRPAPLFQPELLEGQEPVFLVEGTFDALSAEELGYGACGMNGAGNREQIAALLRRRTGTAPVLLLPDADPAGEQWADALCGEFSFLWRCPRLPSGKDLNELLVADRSAAARFLADCVEQQKAFRPTPYRELSAAGQLGSFSRYIEAQAARPPLKTGWPQLDEALDGGLYDGLYVLGAVSSLGKTAFCMQLADQLAQQGRDVLIFSLEMTAYELMARSISRETFLRDDTRGRKLAKTVRGVLDGRRYPDYSEQEHLHLYNSEKRYAEYAQHLFFREGDHETGLAYLESEIRRHMDETGVKPVVLIDYLQIIAPVDVHFTDKQNLDRIVCALKKLSRELELTVLAISSFNRENYNTPVSMTAFKESGGIDYSADVLLGIQPKGAGRSGFSVEDELRKDPRELELKILKNRSAALGLTVPFRYYPAFSCFMEGKR